MGRAWAWGFLYGLAVLGVPAAAMMFGQAADGHSLGYQAGRCLALAGFTILCLQVALTGRLRVVERPFGLDVLARFHRRAGVGAGVLLACHPALLAVFGLGPGIFVSLRLPWYIWAAKGAALLVFANIAVSRFQRRLGIGFERWRFAHDLLGPAIVILIFVHAWFVRKGFQGTALAYAVPLLAGGSLALFVWHRIIRPMRAARRPYVVTGVSRGANQVWTLTFAPPKGCETYAYLPGQFHFVTLKTRALPWQEHHFTIASSPARAGEVSSTIKDLGDFTADIGKTAPGDTAVLEGPFGRFSYLLHPKDRDVVFLAGGIGITPLMGMLRHMRDTGARLPVMLAYANKSEADIVFRAELDAIAAGESPRLRVAHVLSRPDEGWTGERGHLDETMLRRVLGENMTGKAFYVSGPPGFVTAALRSLKRLGVPERRIRRERFSLLD